MPPPRAPRPAYLDPKATHLPEGHDDTLDPAEPPTDATVRSAPPTDWPAHNSAKGGTEPPEAPLAPPPTDPAVREAAPFDWPFVISGPGPENRGMAELASPLGDLDPDIAMWPVTILQRWPFTGPPPTGVWPAGWMGVDNQQTIWMCIVGGQPATWQTVGNQPGPPGPGVATGAMSQFAGPSAPSGYLLCDGTGYSTATYANLFAVIGYLYGGSGTTFNVPNMAGRLPIGAGGGFTLAGTGGEQAHTLSIAELPSHNHGHPTGGGATGPDANFFVIGDASSTLALTPAAGNNVSYTPQPTDVTGGGAAHNNLPPYLCLNWIIKT